jgi:hypothetical protein
MALIGLLGLGVVGVVKSEVPRGVAVVPRNFPNHSAADVENAIRLTREAGRHAVFIYQWGALNPDIVKALFIRARRAGLTPILGLSPTTLDQRRKELDLPAPVRSRAGGDVSFANPVVRSAYIRAARDLARLKPAYLCLATEINLLAMQRLPEYLHFVAVYKEAYHAVKRISPRTRVFVTFQWEWMRILDAREPERIAEHSGLIDILRPELDLVGFTSYPSPFHETPAQLPPDYYTWMFRHIRPDDPVMIMEVGWPTSASGSEGEQVEFLELLPGLMQGVNLVGLEWALLHDVQHRAFDVNTATTGLRYLDGRPKPGYGAFRALEFP